METAKPSLFDRLRQGLEEGIEYAEGKRTLRATTVSLPDPPRAYTAADIKEIRDKRNLSQATLARILCVSSKTVQSWEQGVRKPAPSTARLLQMIEDPRVLDRITGVISTTGAHADLRTSRVVVRRARKRPRS